MKLHNEELQDLYSSPSISRFSKSNRTRFAWCVVCIGKNRDCVWVQKTGGNRRFRSIWEENKKVGLKEIG